MRHRDLSLKEKGQGTVLPCQEMEGSSLLWVVRASERGEQGVGDKREQVFMCVTFCCVVIGGDEEVS